MATAAEKAWLEALRLSAEGRGARSMSTPIGQKAYVQTGAMMIKLKTADARQRFVEIYALLENEEEEFRQSFFADLQMHIAQ